MISSFSPEYRSGLEKELRSMEEHYAGPSFLLSNANLYKEALVEVRKMLAGLTSESESLPTAIRRAVMSGEFLQAKGLQQARIAQAIVETLLARPAYQLGESIPDKADGTLVRLKVTGGEVVERKIPAPPHPATLVQPKNSESSRP